MFASLESKYGVSCRIAEPQDREDLSILWGKQSTPYFFGVKLPPFTSQQVERALRMFEGLRQAREGGLFIFSAKENRRFMGYCGLLRGTWAGGFEILLGFHTPLYRVALIRDTTKAVLNFAFQELNGEKAFTLVDSKNWTARAEAKGAGILSIRKINIQGDDYQLCSVSRKAIERPYEVS